MLIWHKIFKDGKYRMRTNMVLVRDMVHLTNILITKYPGLRVNDMSSIPGNNGLWRLTDKDGSVIGEAYDPDIYRLYPGTARERVVPAYKDFYDNEGKFCAKLFKAFYGVNHGI